MAPRLKFLTVFLVMLAVSAEASPFNRRVWKDDMQGTESDSYLYFDTWTLPLLRDLTLVQ